MAGATLIPVSEYLQTTYRPDREYIDGEVVERNLGKWMHARLQWLLALWFGQHESQWDVIGSTEQRVRISATRVRIPDLVVLRPGRQPDVLSDPPLFVIEILSPDDTYSSLQDRCSDFLALGVGTIWIIDPTTRSGRMCRANEWIAAHRLEVNGTAIYVDLPELFAKIETPSDS